MVNGSANHSVFAHFLLRADVRSHYGVPESKRCQGAFWLPPFVGFKNFEFLFATTDAWIITRNTVCYNLVFICVNMFFAVLLALLLSELTFRKTAKTLQTIYMLPYFLSWAVVSIILIAFLGPRLRPCERLYPHDRRSRDDRLVRGE